MREKEISRTIFEEYNNRLLEHLENEVVIIGSGPAGLSAAFYLAKSGVKTALFEKRLSIGGGIWGGSAGYSMITVEESGILEEIGVRFKKSGDLYVADAVDLVVSLGAAAVHAGAAIFNLKEFEDFVIKDNKVVGVVMNNTTINMAGLPVDPFCVISQYVVDATGHKAEVAAMLRKKAKDFREEQFGEGPMDVERSEREVVEKTGEVYPGVFLAGMSVCAVYNIPRMGPIFGGMLESGRKAAQLLIERLR
jgi:sulfide-dependent adenosine diphosphate thiazole synthase